MVNVWKNWEPGVHWHWNLFLVGPKQLVLRIVLNKNGKNDGGILINLWNPEIVKAQVNPIKSNIFLKHIAYIWILLDGLGIFVFLGNQVFESLRSWNVMVPLKIPTPTLAPDHRCSTIGKWDFLSIYRIQFYTGVLVLSCFEFDNPRVEFQHRRFWKSWICIFWSVLVKLKGWPNSQLHKESHVDHSGGTTTMWRYSIKTTLHVFCYEDTYIRS